MGSREGGERDEGGTAEEAGAVYTDPQLAAQFIDETGLDILACSFGTVHGIYKGEPHLNFDVLTGIRELRNIPLVMHGGSGVSDEDYHKAIDAGIRKINFSTDLCYTFLDTIFATPRDKVGIDLFMKDAVAAVKQFAISKIRLLDANNRV
jgi:fructose/tagatose bisphosphate aldolase